jgi:hypothetical protein
MLPVAGWIGWVAASDSDCFQKVTVIQAALLCRVDQESIQKWIQDGVLHALEAPAGGLLICLASVDRQR